MEDYFYYYILSYFHTEEVVRLSQIFHVLRGKKTPSMYYLTEINHWHHGFSFVKRIEKADLKKTISPALTDYLLLKKDDGFILTKKGNELVKEYFKRHYYPKEIKNFGNIELYIPFWNRLQLFTQVFSEFSYKNTNYLAVIKNPNHQEKVRQLFQVTGGKIDRVVLQWIEEQSLIFEKLEEEKADFLANFLTGHKIIGKTRTQVANQLNLLDYEINFYLRDILEEIIELLIKNQKKLALTYKIFEGVQSEYFMSLSKSTFETYQMLKQGYPIQKIASVRKIKENTVKEHILEIAFVVPGFPVENYVSKSIYSNLYNQFTEDKNMSFKEALSNNEDLEFYQYRLVELERLRID